MVERGVEMFKQQSLSSLSSDAKPTSLLGAMCNDVRWITLRFAFVVLLIIVSALAVPAQDCTNLAPSGDTTGHTDWTNINNTCLNGASHSVKLGIGTFYIHKQIEFPQVSGAKLLGSGNTVSGSVLTAVYASGDCAPNTSCFVDPSGNPQFPFQYKPIVFTRNAPNGEIMNFLLNLEQLQRNFNHLGSYAVQVGTGSRPSPGTQVTSVRIVGSQLTSGWANGGGIIIVSSSNCTVSNNVLKDFGFMKELGGGSAGASAILVQNSGSVFPGSAILSGNTITRVAFGIVLQNQPNQSGNSSSTTISGNNITGATALTCSDCAGGRAIKFEVFGNAAPLQYLSVQNNTAKNWGGQNQAGVSPSGLDLSSGVQYSTFTGNNIDGSTDIRASYGLQVRSSVPMQPQIASHHNTLTNNTFRSGPCGGCFDVKFNADGPDQGRAISGAPDIGRRSVNGGNNVFTTMDWTPGPDRGCLQFAHAFFDYPTGQNFVNRGQNITLAAAGIRPDSSLVTFFFYKPNGDFLTSVQYPGGNGNCVMNQQPFYINPAIFTETGMYKILATYNDGNSDAQIVNDWIGTQGQQTLLDVR